MESVPNNEMRNSSYNYYKETFVEFFRESGKTNEYIVMNRYLKTEFLEFIA